MPRATDLGPSLKGAAAETPGATLGGEDFRRLLQSATTWLERNAAAVDALNVFPVPDGDTGTNMLLTMRAALDGARKVKGSAAGAVLKGAAQGAVMGARGNSGVILSQIVAGIARGTGEHETCDGSLLAAALAEGAATAYRAVSRPVEGTILTVARLAGDGAVAAAGQPPAGVPLTCRYVMERAHSAAREAVERTPEQLPVLRQSGVVDAGGEGYRVILEGMALDLAGESLPESPSTTPHTGEGARAEGSVPLVLDAQDGGEWGYCTQFLIHGDALDVMRLREDLQKIAESTLVVGDESFVRVHGHTENPGELLTFAVRYGRLQRISIEDMDAQHDAWLRNQVQSTDTEAAESPAEGEGPSRSTPAPTVPLGTVAVAPGSGLADVLRSLGALEIVPGGQTMNPSAGELLEAARRSGAETVILLPNNGNVVSTAEHAIGVAQNGSPRVLVVPTRTVPQGIAAQLAFDPQSSPEENVATMTGAAGAVRTVEVTRATRSATIGELEVGEGDILGLLDDKVVAAAAEPLVAATRALDLAGAGKAELITVYRGEAPDEPEAAAFVEALQGHYQGAEIQLVYGGQPHYDYMISVE
ncbi:MAG TPA: DAK2 domain-containing protein [Chloroflexota bacterium]|nr:DAK2 domain-containing protein [Chloroflexota bacterium]